MKMLRHPAARRAATPVISLILIGFSYAMARFACVSPMECGELAVRFRFEQLPLPEVPDHPPYKHVHEVHPSLSRISAWISSLGAGATLADWDGDGLPNDVAYSDPRTGLVTLAPVPRTGERYPPFTLKPAPLPYDTVTMAPMGILAGDFNEDGLMDALVYYWGRTPVLFLRRSAGSPQLGPGEFVPRELVEGGERWYSNGAVQADLDGDGHLDLVIGNYFRDGARILDPKADGVEVMHEGKSKALNGGKKHLFLWAEANSGTAPGARFREVSQVLDPAVEHGWTLAIGAADLDGDLLPELYFAHDFGPDRLLHNRSRPGHLKFAVVEGRRGFTDPKSCVLGCDSFKGMGVDFADLNGDGWLDIYVSNIATRFGLTESHFLWLSTGRPEQFKQGLAPYVQASEKLGLSRSGWGWDCRLADFDNDSVLEAIQAVGFIKGKINRWPELQSLGTSNDRIVQDPRLWPSFKPGADLSGHDLNPFFVRAADGRYYDIGPAVGFTAPKVSKGIALGDVDGDGRLDFVMANQWEPSVFFHNLSPNPGSFLGLHLVLPGGLEAGAPFISRAGHPSGDLRGQPAVGAEARVRLPDGRVLVAQVDGGSGHSGRRSPKLHFGLGETSAETLLDVELRWRDGLGAVHHTSVHLKPGWHSVRLGPPPGPQIATASPNPNPQP